MKKIKHLLQNYLWLFPFCSFLIGYFLLYHYMKIPTLLAPSLIGKNIHEATILLSQHKLNARIIDQKEEPALPEGTILRQVPATGQKIKPSQSIFLVTTKKQPTSTTPSMINKSLNTIKKELANSDIRFKIYYLPSNYPQHHCFSQFPAPGEPLVHNLLLLYLSTEDNKPIIWPNFTQHPIEEVIEFLAFYYIQPQVIWNTQKHSINKVIEQQPLAGSLILLQKNNPLFVQLRVE
ncbi:MAG: PASTA domain-containing protein [Candidatus Babeliales bacterium]